MSPEQIPADVSLTSSTGVAREALSVAGDFNQFIQLWRFSFVIVVSQVQFASLLAGV